MRLKLSLDRLEERVDSGDNVARAGSAHGPPEAIPAQNFLIVVKALLLAVIGMMDADHRWPPRSNRHVQDPHRQIAFDPVPDPRRSRVSNTDQV